MASDAIARQVIAFVDDDVLVLRAFKRDLHEWARARSVELVTFEKAKACLDFLSKESSRVVIVVSDLRMPEGPGSRFLLEVSASWPRIMTMLLAGPSDAGELMKTARADLFGHIFKPWEAPYLRGELERALEARIFRIEMEMRTAELRESEERIRHLLDSTADAICGLDQEGNVTFVNRAGLAVLGYTDAGQVVGRQLHGLVHHSRSDGSPLLVGDCSACEGFRSKATSHRDEEVFWKADGKSFPVECWSHVQAREGEACGAVLVFRDITERKEAAERIRHMATHDRLTGLPVTSLARDRLSMALELSHRHKRRVAVLFIDLDGFKEVNDLHGHVAGDAVLVEVAWRLSGCVRKMDTVARVGADEFLIVAIELESGEDAAKIAGKVLERIPQPIRLGSVEVRLGTSVGIAVSGTEEGDAAALIKRADDAMRQVKQAGKNGFGFADPEPPSPEVGVVQP